MIQAFAALVRSEIQDEIVDLLRAALTFARIEDPEVDVESYVRRVEELSRRVAARIASRIGSASRRRITILCSSRLSGSRESDRGSGRRRVRLPFL